MKEFGLRIAGVAEAVMAAFGCILPSLLIVSLLACIYYRHQWGMILQGIQYPLHPAVVALIASARPSILWQGSFHGLPPSVRKALSLAGLLTLPLSLLPVAKVPLESHPDNAPLLHRQPHPGPAGRTDVSFRPRLRVRNYFPALHWA